MSIDQNSVPPLATYREKSPGLRRTHSLFANKVTIQGKSFGGQEVVMHIALSNLIPDIGVNRYRSHRCILGALCCCIFAFMFANFLFNRGYPLLSQPVLGVIAFFLISLVWTAIYFPKCTAYHFTNAMGVLVLDVIEAGPEKANAMGFAKQISEAIQSCQAAEKQRT